MAQYDWGNMKDLLLAAGEGAFSGAANTFFDVGSFGAEAVSNPLLFAQSFADRDKADQFAQQQAQRRAHFPELGQSARTEEIFGDIGEKAAEGWNWLSEKAPEATDTAEQYFGDPRVQHTLQTAGLAAPSFMRAGKAFKTRPRTTGRMPSRGMGKQEGHIMPLTVAADRFEKIGDTAKAKKLRDQAHFLATAIAQTGGNPKPEYLDMLHRRTGHHIVNTDKGYQTFYELDDTGMTMKDDNFIENATRSGEQLNLEDVYEHPELFRLMPELRKNKIGVEDLGDDIEGKFDPDTGAITLSPRFKEGWQSTIPHETEHMIQKATDQYGGANTGLETANKMILGSPEWGLDSTAVTRDLMRKDGFFDLMAQGFEDGADVSTEVLPWAKHNLTEFAKRNPEHAGDYAKAYELIDDIAENVEMGFMAPGQAVDQMVEALADPGTNYLRSWGEITARIAEKKAQTGKMGPLHRELLDEGKIFKPELAIQRTHADTSKLSSDLNDIIDAIKDQYGQ